MDTALRPTINLPSLDKDTGIERSAPSDREQALYAMGKTGGWKIFNTMCTELMSDLDQANRAAIAQGMSFADIGQNTVVVNMAKDIISRLLDKVADATKACDNTNES